MLQALLNFLCKKPRVNKGFFVFFAISEMVPLGASLEFLGKDSCLEFVGEEAFLILESDIANFSGTLKLPGDTIADNVKNLDQYAINFEQGSLLLKNHALPTQISCQVGQLTKATRDTVKKVSTLVLAGDQTLNFSGVSVLEAIEVKGKNNLICGTPSFTEKIFLADAAAELDLCLQSKLTKNIVLNGGKIKLLADLFLKDQVSLEGKGVIDINGFRLAFPANNSAPIPHQLIFANANDIQLSGYTTVDGTWTFSGNGTYSTINGFGNVLDLSLGGSIIVGQNHTLFITGVDIKGLGDAAGTFNLDTTATVKFSSSTIELSGSYTFTSGKISIISPNCNLIIRDKNYLVLTGPNGTLEVDGVILNYDTIGNAPIYPPPFAVFPGGNISLLNDAVIQSSKFQSVNGEFQITLPSSYGINYIIGNVIMNTYTIVHFVNENPAVYKPMILDCTGKTIRYDGAENGSIVVDENVDLYVQNLIAYGLDFVKLDLRGTGTTRAKVHFGDNLYCSLDRDTVVDDIPWLISGEATIEANNFTITLTASDQILIDDGAHLTISNATINMNCNNGLALLGDDAKITFVNCAMKLGMDGWLFTQGNIEAMTYFSITHVASCDYYAMLNFQSKGTFTIREKTNLYLDNIKFCYQPTPTSVDESAASLKRRLTFADDTSYLFLHHCLIDTRPTGFALDQGNLIITDKVHFYIDPTPTAALELGINLQLTVNPSSIIEVDGLVVYGLT